MDAKTVPGTKNQRRLFASFAGLSLFDIRRSHFGIITIRVHSWWDSLQNEHAIAVAVEAITFTNRFLIRAQQKLSAGERADEHQQSRTRQMEIR
jgi:hypothetical protein